MIHSTLPAKRAVSEIVRAYRHVEGRPEHPLSLRVFAASLSAIVEHFGGSISHQTVKNWQDRNHLPNAFFMMQIAYHAPFDWRRDFAQDVLAALRPDIYQPATEIGQRALEHAREEALLNRRKRRPRPPVLGA